MSIQEVVPYKAISTIQENEPAEPIQIRVIKKWTPAQQTAEFCYLFVDIHGDAMQASASANEEARLNTIVNVQSCYIVDKYICLPQKNYNAAVPHKACLRIGKKATFFPVIAPEIPDHYYNFVSYSDLAERERPPKMLTDYIGRVEKKREVRVKKTNQLLKKIKIQDIRENTIEITFWPSQASLYPEHAQEGDILAITYASVTSFEGKFQLESTPATTATVNPNTPDVAAYISRFCVNATITDNESEANVVFFDEAMRQMINMTCEELVSRQGHYDQRHIPDAINRIINVQKLMMITIRHDLIAVNSIATSAPTPISLTPDTPVKKPRLMIKEKKA